MSNRDITEAIKQLMRKHKPNGDEKGLKGLKGNPVIDSNWWCDDYDCDICNEIEILLRNGN